MVLSDVEETVTIVEVEEENADAAVRVHFLLSATETPSIWTLVLIALPLIYIVSNADCRRSRNDLKCYSCEGILSSC